MEFENQRIENLQYTNEYLEDFEYIDCNFYNCKFINVRMNNCTFIDCEFYNCVFSIEKIEVCKMRNSVFSNCVLIGINWSDLTQRGNRSFPISTISDSVMKFNRFIDIDLTKFNFSSSKFQESYFYQCNLTRANFQNVSLQNSEFVNCNLSYTDFRGATEYIINIMDSKLKGTKFSTPEVINLLNVFDIVIE